MNCPRCHSPDTYRLLSMLNDYIRECGKCGYGFSETEVQAAVIPA